MIFVDTHMPIWEKCMIKLLIVDDEKNTREGLRKTIPWADLGIGKVYEAQNGIEGLQVVEEIKPELILCDVRMPKMDGIVFSQKVKEMYPSCKIIFLSGFSDKEYLKSAIKLGAVDYIEKPARIADLKAVVINAVRLIREEAGKQAREQVIEQHLNESRLLLRQELALKLIEQTTDFTSLSEHNQRIYAFLGENSGYTAAAVLVSGGSGSGENSVSSFCKSIVQWLNTDEISLRYGCLSSSIKDTVLAIIFTKRLGHREALQPEIRDFFTCLMDKAAEAGYKCSIGIGEPVALLDKIPLSYASAFDAADKQFFRGSGRILFPGPGEGQEWQLNDEFYAVFERQLAENLRDEAVKAVYKLTADLRRSEKTDKSHIRSIYIKLYSMVEDIYGRIFPDAGTTAGAAGGIWMDAVGLVTLDDMEKWLLTRLNAFFDSFAAMGSDDAIIYKIKAYIGRHYSNKAISLKLIADNVHLSLNYMCNVFKSKTGCTINDYITRVRLEKARALLKDGSRKTYEVADAAGFENPNYFAKLFKGHYGETPSEYREKLKI